MIIIIILGQMRAAKLLAGGCAGASTDAFTVAGRSCRRPLWCVRLFGPLGAQSVAQSGRLGAANRPSTRTTFSALMIRRRRIIGAQWAPTGSPFAGAARKKHPKWRSPSSRPQSSGASAHCLGGRPSLAPKTQVLLSFSRATLGDPEGARRWFGRRSRTLKAACCQAAATRPARTLSAKSMVINFRAVLRTNVTLFLTRSARCGWSARDSSRSIARGS